jgi:hypothetical protein
MSNQASRFQTRSMFLAVEADQEVGAYLSGAINWRKDLRVLRGDGPR